MPSPTLLRIAEPVSPAALTDLEVATIVRVMHDLQMTKEQILMRLCLVPDVFRPGPPPKPLREWNRGPRPGAG